VSEPAQRKHVLLAADFDAAIFDLDGVITQTARVHAQCWKRLFDELLRQRSADTGEPFKPFDAETDYLGYVDGKPRFDGVRDFLRSRDITLPEGDPDDGPDAVTIYGLGLRKNLYFREHLENQGVEAFDSSVRLVGKLRGMNIKTALASSSRNAGPVLEATGLTHLFEVRVDGNDLDQLGLNGKPAPDLFLLAAERLATAPDRAIVFEDAISGVAAGRAGNFVHVIGVDRAGAPEALRQAGADIVVPDLAFLDVQAGPKPDGGASPANALADFGEIAARLTGKHPAVFLDYDGTLTPIVARPDLAILSEEMRTILRDLAGRCSVGIISGRDQADVRALVDIDDLIYAGSHGFDIVGPDGLHIRHDQASTFAAAVEQATERLRPALAAFAGVLIEAKRFAVAVHYRQVADDQVPQVEAAVDRVLEAVPDLHKTHGKKVFELRPRFDWDKGKAVLWLMSALGQTGAETLPFYIGDDLTDEDAFRALSDRGVTIFVGRPEQTAAGYVLDDPDQVGAFLKRLTGVLGDAHRG
jgi:trehalose 6-phosphate phosphatase